MRSPIDIISETLQREVGEIAKKYLLTPNRYETKYYAIKRARRHSQSMINSMKSCKGIDSVKRTKLPRKLKKKNKKQGIVKLDITYVPEVPVLYVEFNGLLLR